MMRVTAFGGFHGVLNKVDQHLVKLIGVGLHRRQAGVQKIFQADVFSPRRPGPSRP